MDSMWMSLGDPVGRPKTPKFLYRPLFVHHNIAPEFFKAVQALHRLRVVHYRPGVQAWVEGTVPILIEGVIYE